MITVDQVLVAKQAAVEASNEYFMTHLNGRDTGYCGFAWVEVEVERTNSAQAKELIKAGFKKHWTPKCMSMWNPGGLSVQNMEVKDVGARQMAAMLANLGLKAYAGSRPD